MIALVTGASSGIGRDIARSLAKHGINVIITARRKDRLRALKEELIREYGVKVQIIAADLSDTKQCIELHRRVKKYGIDIFVNNAGFGEFGEFTESDLDRELEMLDECYENIDYVTLHRNYDTPTGDPPGFLA